MRELHRCDAFRSLDAWTGRPAHSLLPDTDVPGPAPHPNDGDDMSLQDRTRTLLRWLDEYTLEVYNAPVQLRSRRPGSAR
jgi:hypothetical protein